MGHFFLDDTNCARARSWTSQEADKELSQLERLFLATHIRRCAECARFAEEVRSFTRVVRSQPLERPARSFEIPVRRQARVGLGLTRRIAIATLLVAVAGGLGMLAGAGGGGSSSETTSAVGDVAFVIPKSADRELRDLRRVKAERSREPISPPGRLGGFV